MFVTVSRFKQFMPPNLVSPDQEHWGAVTLSTEAPWYLFVYEVEYADGMLPQTTLVSWETTLVDVIAGVPGQFRKAVGRLDRESQPVPRWGIKWVETIWAAAPDEVEETGPVLMQFEGDPQLRDAHMEPVPVRGGRELLFSAPPRSANAAPSAASRTEVPSDFPYSGHQGGVPGAQPKVVVGKHKGMFTDQAARKHLERYQICQDLYDQVVAYAEHKRLETPSLALASLLAQVLATIEKKRFGWGLSPAEARWLSERVRAHFLPN